MPDKVYLQGSIAGVPLTGPGGVGLKASLIGRENFESGEFILYRQSANGNAFVNTFDFKGTPFGVEFQEIDVTAFQAIKTAIKAAIDSQDTFAVDVEDDVTSIDVDALVPGTDWLKMPTDKRTNSITIRGPIQMLFVVA